MRVYRAAIRPSLLYGCETWPLRPKDVRKLEAFDHWCLRVITRTRWYDRTTDATVRQRCEGVHRLSSLIQHRRLQLFGHVLRRPDTEMTKLVLNPGSAGDAVEVGSVRHDSPQSRGTWTQRAYVQFTERSHGSGSGSTFVQTWPPITGLGPPFSVT